MAGDKTGSLQRSKGEELDPTDRGALSGLVGWIARRPSAAVVVAGAPTLFILMFGATGNLAVVMTVAGLVVSLLVALALSTPTSAQRQPVPPALWWSVGALAVAAVLRWPLGSHDLWSYASYGRMVTRYGANPYTSTPSQFPHDLVLPLVNWRETPSVYGPLFTGYSAFGAAIAGNSILATRLFFQGTAAAAVLWCLALLRRVRNTGPLVLIATSPFVWVSLVNGGHNDALVALGVLGAVIAFDRQRWFLAGALAAAGGMVKFPGLFVMAPFMAVLLTRRNWRAAVEVSIGPAVAALTTLILFPDSLSNASSATGTKISRSSIWRPVQLLTHAPPKLLTMSALALTLGVIVVISYRGRHKRDVSFSAGSSAAVFGLSASYTLPWYLIWGLPTLALSGDLALTAIVATRGSLQQVSYELVSGSQLARVLGFGVTTIAPIALMGLFLSRVLVARPLDATDDPGGATDLSSELGTEPGPLQRPY